ncbi:MAG: 3-phosphoserine/phosphohydroxythreonine transaminase [Pseudomonadota bacterium]
MASIYNFSAGPSALPKPVLAKAQEELLDWNNLGVSVMEISHRGKDFLACAEKAEADFRKLMAIPDDYEVLFLQGGGRGQFFSVPMNLAKRGDYCQHLLSGQWSQIAVTEAKKYMDVEVVGKASLQDGLLMVPDQEHWQIKKDAAYFHYCPNETVDGIEIDWAPESKHDVPVVADMSSNILSKSIDIEKFGIIYAGAQKNIGPSGLAIVIIKKDLLGYSRDDTPAVFDYAQQAKDGSMYNTPPTFGWYLAGLVFEWLLDIGGLEEMQKRNESKAKLLYSTIDSSDLYSNNIASEYRSKMNVTFHLKETNLDKLFLDEAEKVGLRYLKGHRFVGGMRASIYNAMPLEGVQTLVAFMKEFEKRHG